MKYFFRLEKGSEDKIGSTFGPFEDYLQLTYDTLQHEGQLLAENVGNEWVVCCHDEMKLFEQGDGFEGSWTDIVIFAEKD